MESALVIENRSLSLMTYLQSTVSDFSADGSGWLTLLYPLVTIERRNFLYAVESLASSAVLGLHMHGQP